MFTIKYRSYTLNTKRSNCGEGPIYDEHELIDGPFTMISKEFNEEGYPVVYAHREHNAPGMTYGAFNVPDVAGQPNPRPMLWVMNDHGATVAKYDL
jgi:hypothetical protein